MKSVWLMLLLCLTTVSFASESQDAASVKSEHSEMADKAAAAVVDGHLEAFNDHDLEVFLTFFHPEIESYKFTGELELQCIEALREAFIQAFTYTPNEVVEQRIIDGNYVIDKVKVQFNLDGQTMIDRGVVIYTLEDGLIRKMTFL